MCQLGLHSLNILSFDAFHIVFSKYMKYYAFKQILKVIYVHTMLIINRESKVMIKAWNMP